MSLNRREFIQALAIASVGGMSLQSELASAQAQARSFYDLPRFGNVHLLHFTDCHAQLLPVYFREPNVNIGLGQSLNKAPHLVGEKLLKAFGAGMFHYPHGIFIDRNDHIWVVDGVSKNAVVGDTIRIFDQDGKLLETHGTEGVRGAATDPYNYNEVSDVLQAPNGDIFVADGHDPDGNFRMLKYDSHWKFITMWGQKGNRPEDFNPPHGLAMDKEGRLYVADRGNRAVKRFDQNGKLLDVWTQFGQPSGVFIDKNDILYVADSTSNPATSAFSPGIRMAKVSDGKIFGNIPWPEQGTEEGVAVADDGTIYGGYTNIPGAHRFLKN